MICCPMLKVEPSPACGSCDPDTPYSRRKGHGGSQGFVSWKKCTTKCEHNKGYEKKLEIKCGYDPKNISNIKSIPI